MTSPVLDTRNRVKQIIQSALTIPVYYPFETRGAGVTEYVVIQDISAPTTEDWDGVAHSTVRVQVDLYTLQTTDFRAASLGNTLENAFPGREWSIKRPGKPLSFDPAANADTSGKRWFRYSFDAIRTA